jgi:hypothetical protein
VVISHDRWFLDRVATHILAYEGDDDPAKWYWFEGNFEAYEKNKVERLGADAARPHRVTYRKLTRGLRAGLVVPVCSPLMQRAHAGARRSCRKGCPTAMAPPFTFSRSQLDAQLLMADGTHLGRERLVDLDQVDVADRHAGDLECQRLADRLDRAEAHDLRRRGRTLADDDTIRASGVRPSSWQPWCPTS